MSKAYLDSIIDSIPDAVWVVELNPDSPADPSVSRIVRVNAAAATLFHCSRDALVGKSLPDLVSPTAVNEGAWWATVTSGQDVFGVELDLLGPNHVEVPVMLVASGRPSRPGRCRHVICVAQDMTQRQLAAYLLRENDRLLDEITRLHALLAQP